MKRLSLSKSKDTRSDVPTRTIFQIQKFVRQVGENIQESTGREGVNWNKIQYSKSMFI